MIEPRKYRWRRPRFTLGALLLLFVLCAIPLAYIAHVRAKNVARHTAWQRLVAKGVRFTADIPATATVTDLDGGWWGKLLKVTPKFRSIEIAEFSTGGKPPVIQVDNGDLLLLAHFPEVEKIKIESAEQVSDEGLQSLASLPALRVFEANHLPRVAGAFLTTWAESNTIEALFLMDMTKLEARHLTPLEKLSRLRSLTLISAIHPENAPIVDANLPPSLVELRMAFTPIAEDTLARWLSQTRLRTLALDTPFSRKIAPELRRQTKLSFLSIINSPLVDDDLVFLGRCPALYNLVIVGAPVDGSFLRRIPDRTQLDYLTIRGAPLRDEYAAEVKRLKKLAYLDLSWSAINGECIADAQWPMLQHLNLVGCRFSDLGKENLGKLSAPNRLACPNNWTAQDLQRYASGKSPADLTMNSIYKAEAKASSIQVSGFESPTTRIPEIDRCPPELMKPVQDLINRAKAEEAEFDANEGA